jgi:hypothetical protein
MLFIIFVLERSSLRQENHVFGLDPKTSLAGFQNCPGSCYSMAEKSGLASFHDWPFLKTGEACFPTLVPSKVYFLHPYFFIISMCRCFVKTKLVNLYDYRIVLG